MIKLHSKHIIMIKIEKIMGPQYRDLLRYGKNHKLFLE